MGQRYMGTLVVQTMDYYSPVGSYTLELLEDSASSEDVVSGKGLYDSNGESFTGSFVDGWPIEIDSEEKVDEFITLENVNRYIKYTGTSSGTSGVVTPVNPLSDGDIITAVYVNKNIQPDVDAFDWDNPDESGESGGTPHKYIYFFKIALTDNTGVATPFIIAEVTHTSSEGTAHKLYSIELKEGYSVYMFCATATPQDLGLDKHMGITEWGWLKDSSDFGENVVVSDVKYQDIWGAYVSKDGKWTGASKYVSGQVYKVVQNGEVAELKEIQY